MPFDTSDDDDIRSMKGDDNYSFSYSIEYVIDQVGDENSGEYVTGNTTIDVRLAWWVGATCRHPVTDSATTSTLTTLRHVGIDVKKRKPI